MFNLSTHRLTLYESRVSIIGSTWLIMLAEYPKGKIQPLTIANESGEMKAPPIERAICQHLKIKPNELKAIETTTTGAIIYAATIKKG